MPYPDYFWECGQAEGTQLAETVRQDDGRGWCLSTDPNDVNGAWADQCIDFFRRSMSRCRKGSDQSLFGMNWRCSLNREFTSLE